MAKILKILEPMMFPIATSLAPSSDANKLVTISGADVPAAIIVRPIIAGETEKRAAILTADLTRSSPPTINMINPAKISPRGRKYSNFVCPPGWQSKIISLKLNLMYLVGIFLSVFLWTSNSWALCVVADIANLRKRPSSRAKLTLTVGKFTPLVRLGKSKGWYHVADQDGEKHWVYSSLVSGKVKCVSINRRHARLYDGPSFDSGKAAYGKADRYSPFKRLSKRKNWYRLRDASGNTVWVHENDVWRPVRIMKIGF